MSGLRTLLAGGLLFALGCGGAGEKDEFKDLDRPEEPKPAEPVKPVVKAPEKE